MLHALVPVPRVSVAVHTVFQAAAAGGLVQVRAKHSCKSYLMGVQRACVHWLVLPLSATKASWAKHLRHRHTSEEHRSEIRNSVSKGQNRKYHAYLNSTKIEIMQVTTYNLKLSIWICIFKKARERKCTSSTIFTQEPTLESVSGMSVLLVIQVISYETDVTKYVFPVCTWKISRQ